MTTPRRTDLTMPGEPLLLARSIMESTLRTQAWCQTAMPRLTPADHVKAYVSTPLVSVPVPVYFQVDPAADPVAARRTRFAHIDAGAMWHPLFWLPDSVAGRLPLTDTDGSITTESDDEWAMRVAVLAQLSGMYDVETGSWVDVLAGEGLDIDAPGVVERIAAWQGGRPDPILDQVDLSGLMRDDDHWALDVVARLIGEARQASWALVAKDLISQLDLLAAPDAVVPAGQSAAFTVCQIVATLAVTHLTDADDELDVDETWADTLDLLALADMDDDDAVIDEYVPGMVTHLQMVVDAYTPVLEQVESTVAPLTAA